MSDFKINLNDAEDEIVRGAAFYRRLSINSFIKQSALIAARELADSIGGFSEIPEGDYREALKAKIQSEWKEI